VARNGRGTWGSSWDLHKPPGLGIKLRRPPPPPHFSSRFLSHSSSLTSIYTGGLNRLWSHLLGYRLDFLFPLLIYTLSFSFFVDCVVQLRRLIPPFSLDIPYTHPSCLTHPSLPLRGLKRAVTM
jgi:hypothetical protein